MGGQDLRASIVQLLRRSHDTQRLVQKFSLGRGDPEDLIALSRTIEATQGIFVILGDILQCGGAASNTLGQPLPESFSGTACIAELLRRLNLDGPTELADRISQAVDEEGLMRKQRIEESEVADVMATVREVVDAEADEDEKLTILKKGASKGGSGLNSVGDVGFEDVWVMRKRYKSLSSIISL